MGGVEYIKNLLRPMPFLNIIPQGDVQLSEIPEYIKAGALAVGVGRHLTALNCAKDITTVTKELMETLK